MTKAAVQGYINRASYALVAGDCVLANEQVEAGFEALQDYAGVLATHGASPAGIIKLQKALAKIHTRVHRACPTGDELIAPSFHGADGYNRFMPAVGFGFALLGLAIGAGALYRSMR